MNWLDDASCLGMDSAVFFPQPGVGGRIDFGPALAVCARCPSRAACRATPAVMSPLRSASALHGVVGGVAPLQGRGRRLCAWCDTVFAPGNPQQRFCGRQCSARWRTAEERARGVPAGQFGERRPA